MNKYIFLSAKFFHLTTQIHFLADTYFFLFTKKSTRAKKEREKEANWKKSVNEILMSINTFLSHRRDRAAKKKMLNFH
jgi:hypothetical protein